MSAISPPPPQWVLDLNSTPAKPKNASLPDPPGYTAAMTKKERALSSKTARKPPTPEEMDTLKMKKAWEVAIAPAKQLPMNAFGASYPTQRSHHPATNSARHVHDGQHAPDLLHLHGLHPLQITCPGCPRYPTHIRTLRNTRHLGTLDPRQDCLYSLQHADAGTGYLEGQRHGLATDDAVRLAGLGERADMVGTSCATRVVVIRLTRLVSRVSFCPGRR
jgi:hypothetical protein